MSHATLLAHPDPSAPLALVTDASTSAMGAVLKQRVKNDWQTLAFFSQKLNPAQQIIVHITASCWLSTRP
jgi:hypothetical protein